MLRNNLNKIMLILPNIKKPHVVLNQIKPYKHAHKKKIYILQILFLFDNYLKNNIDFFIPIHASQEFLVVLMLIQVLTKEK